MRVVDDAATTNTTARRTRRAPGMLKQARCVVRIPAGDDPAGKQRLGDDFHTAGLNGHAVLHEVSVRKVWNLDVRLLGS